MTKLQKTDRNLFADIASLIEESRKIVAQTANATLSLLYWKIGARINTDVLGNKRAVYGKQVVSSLAQQLTEKYGRGWDEKMLRHCLRSAETFTEDTILYAVGRQLSWTHLRTIMYLKAELEKSFESKQKRRRK